MFQEMFSRIVNKFQDIFHVIDVILSDFKENDVRKVVQSQAFQS